MSVLLDLRHALRRLRRQPGFTALATACLGLGIGASVGAFSLLHTLLLRPLPEAVAPRELVTLLPRPSNVPGLPEVTFYKPLSYTAYRRFREANRAFTQLAAYERVPVSLAVPGESSPRLLSGHLASDNYFETLGLKSALGRTLATGRGASPQTEVVISDVLWHEVFGGRRDVLGRPLLLNGRTFQVAGVMPEGFRGVERTEPVDLWMALEAAPRVVPTMKPGDLGDPAQQWIPNFFARLAPGMTRARAQAEIDVIARLLAKEDPEGQAPALDLFDRVGIHPLMRERIRDTLLVVAAVVSLLMLLVCANLAGLLLTQGVAREREIGIRVAFGATPGRILRQLLSESVLLGLLGGLAGVAVGRGMMRALEAVALDGILPQLAGITLDRQALAFALGVALAAGLLFGFAPALWLSEARWIREGNAATPGRSRLQEAFVVGQIALSLVLLVGTGLFVRSWSNVQGMTPGFEPGGVADFSLDLELQHYGETEGQLLYDQLLERVRRLPGVRTAALSQAVPLAKHLDAKFFGQVEIPGRQGKGKAGSRMVDENLISPGYFATLGIPLVAGRDFSADDRDGAPQVVIVSRSFARSTWGDHNPVGERILIQGDPKEVVGVAADLRASLKQGTQEMLYRPVHQLYFPGLTLHVKTADEAAARAVMAPVRRELAQIDRTVPFKRVSLLADDVGQWAAEPRLFSQLLGGTSGVALLLTGIGLYGTLALAVRRRTREMGIRRALGARTSEVLALVLRRGLALTGAGLVLGTAASLLATRALGKFLFGVTPDDPAVFAAVLAICAALGAAASLLPAWSAARVDPMEALRQEM